MAQIEYDSNVRDFAAESARIARRRKNRRRKRILLAVLAVAVVLFFLSGLTGTSMTALQDLSDTLLIAFTPSSGYPVQTGIAKLYQLEEAGGGFVALGPESCVMYGANGARLRSVQAGYARPVISAGKYRFVLYNRSGTELRVENRTRTLYTHTMGGSILLCEMSDSGRFAAVTTHSRYTAELTVFSPLMESLMVWDMTESEGTPVRMAFSSDSNRLAVASLRAEGGQLRSQLYLVDLRTGERLLLASPQGAVPLYLFWQSNSRILAVYDTFAAVYQTGGGAVLARYEYGGDLLDWSPKGQNVALLLENGEEGRAVLLDGDLQPTAEATVVGATALTLTRTGVYLLTINSVECFSTDGEYQWTMLCSTRPLAVLDARELLLFSGNTAQLLEPPVEEEE